MNKKLIKSIVSVTCGLGVATSIPFVATSCWCSSEDDDVVVNALPEEVYEINSENVLMGFKDAFLNDSASDIYKDKFKDDCDTIKIPDRVTSIGDSAFENSSATQIPSFISHINFTKKSNCSSIGDRAFINCPYITSVTFPSSLTTILDNAFKGQSILSSIVWNGWKGVAATTVKQESFLAAGSSSTSQLTLKVTNPIGSNDSAALLVFLKQKAKLPDNWTVGN